MYFKSRAPHHSSRPLPRSLPAPLPEPAWPEGELPPPRLTGFGGLPPPKPSAGRGKGVGGSVLKIGFWPSRDSRCSEGGTNKNVQMVGWFRPRRFGRSFAPPVPPRPPPQTKSYMFGGTALSVMVATERGCRSSPYSCLLGHVATSGRDSFFMFWAPWRPVCLPGSSPPRLTLLL